MKHHGLIPQIEFVPEAHDDPAEVRILRPRGGFERLAVVRPNELHAVIIRRDGSIENLGISHNLRTTVGQDWQSDTMGGPLPTQGSPATASSATSITATGTPYVANALKGYRVVVPVTGLTTPPVYGNIGSNTTSVITVDQWWNGADGVGTTPSATAGFIILPGPGPARFIGLTADPGAASAASTALTSEFTTLGMSRALATYAHTPGSASYTQSKTFTATGNTGAIHRAGMFTALTLTAGGILVFETVLNADATLANGDQLALTWTVNI